MLPKWHILAGGIFSLILFYLFNFSFLNSFIVFLASVLIDVDHYTFYVTRKKSLNLKKAYIWLKGIPKDHKPMLHIFHTFEFILIFVLLAFTFHIFIFVLAGVLFHSIFDLFEAAYDKHIHKEYFLIRYLLEKDKSKYF